jgi:hypothetical protein
MRESIVSRLIAKRLVDDDYLKNPIFRAHFNLYQKGGHEIHLMLRHCWIRYATGPEISGGLYAELSTRTYVHSGKSYRRIIRIKRGWTCDKVIKRLSREIFALEQDEKLYLERERLYCRINQQCENMDPDTLDRMIAAAESRGITAAYDAMGEEALDYWNKLF